MSSHLSKRDIRTEISPYYYWLMLTPIAISYAKQFIYEENANIDDYLINNLNNFAHFNVVGGGDFMYLSKAMDYGINYTCIEPYIDMYINDSAKVWINYINNRSNCKINFIAKSLDNLEFEDLNQNGKKLYFFIFNVISYILDPLGCINNLRQPGDVFVISCWNKKSKDSMTIRKNYFDFLNKKTQEINVPYDNDDVLLDVDKIEKEVVNISNCRVKRITQNITDTLIIEF